MNLRSCPAPHHRRNLAGGALRKFRLERGWSQSDFAAQLQRSGWDLDRSVIVRIESGKRTLLDFEVAFLLRILQKKWTDLAVDLEHN